MTRSKSFYSVMKAIRKQVTGTMVVMVILSALTSCSSVDDELSAITAPPSATSPQKLKIFEDFEQMPSFHGGTAKLLEYINENLHYPQAAKDSCIQGRVVVSFMIEKDGSITEAKVAKSLNPLLDTEAVRIVESMPKWNPGKFYGKAVRIKYCVPIKFQLEQ